MTSRGLRLQARAYAPRWGGRAVALLMLTGWLAVVASAAAQPLLQQARLLEQRGELTAALELLDRAVAREPSQHDLWVSRGSVQFKLGNIEASLVDFDRAVALESRVLPYLWQRGIALYYLEQWNECIAQFEAHRTVNPNDVENAAWHFLCVARRDGIESARRQLLPVGPDRRAPLPEIYRLYRGDLTAEQVLAVAEDSAGSRRDAMFYAHLYIALLAEVRGAGRQTALHLRSAEALEFPHYMGDVARVHLARLEGTTAPSPRVER